MAVATALYHKISDYFLNLNGIINPNYAVEVKLSKSLFLASKKYSS
jgi:hypothetical protein